MHVIRAAGAFSGARYPETGANTARSAAYNWYASRPGPSGSATCSESRLPRVSTLYS